jgi:hypothetical protein
MKLYKWFSICSQHSISYRDDNCPRCQVGHWVFMPTYYIRHFLYKFVPGYKSLWFWYRNLPANRGMKFFDKKTGKKVNPFPNLK